MNEIQQKASEAKQREVARTLARGMSPGDRAALAVYVEVLYQIRASPSHPVAKAKQAWAATLSSAVVWPVVRTILTEIKRHAWDERGTKGRAGIASSVAALAVFGSQGAGIAALGGAIGVPLWLVFGAGGAFLAGLYEELHRKAPPSAPERPPSKVVPEAEQVDTADVVDVQAKVMGEPLALPSPAASSRDARRTITSGDVIVCLQCSRKRVVTQEWLDAISRGRVGDSVSRYGLQASDVGKLKCAACNARALEVRRA